MIAAALRVLAGDDAEERPRGLMLREAVRAEFVVDVYRPTPGDPVLYGPTCAVAGCPGRGMNRSLGLKAKGANRSIGTRFRDYLCQAHVEMWRRDGEPQIDLCVRHSARALRSQRAPDRCAVSRCRRSSTGLALCQP
ncbi:MAG: hypothetical protein M3065_01690, partial [Actinomycetota bacterium]|nr:hypothetical protein [Actinomycetota bacterium]